MGNFAPDKRTKEMVIENIRDEFNRDGLSHEQLYLLFAQSFGVDLTNELLEENAYFPFARGYINAQLKWLRSYDWDHRLAFFAAIERLDNIDYVNFRNVAINMGTDKKYLTFFNVHISAKHFEGILANSFSNLWKKNKTLLKMFFGL